jgi:predicted metal-dependent phosphoesterase TrpH
VSNAPPARGQDAPGLVDLHAHTTASDGVLAPAQLVELAVARGLVVLAVTDHDTTDGVERALAAAAGSGLRVIPSVELSTDVPAGEVHVLGYFVEPRSPVLADSLRRFREARHGRARRMVEQLIAVGVPITFEAVAAIAGEGAIGRPHVARALVAAGCATSVNDAFARYLVRGRPGYVERFKLTPVDAVRLIRDSGGVPVLAHPLSAVDLDALLPELIAAGLGGLEVYYGDYDEAARAGLLTLARRHDLAPTGGTDYHGPNIAHSRDLGDAGVPLECVAALEARLQRAAGRG